MPAHTPFTQSFDQLPASLAIFPLPNAVVFPGSHLPLNIFEPRYINMVQDAMRDSQLIGMIQPASNSPQPDLQKVGCAGRITRYEETLDGRFHILLTGVCRFEIEEELNSIRGYRIIVPNWLPYKSDFDTAEAPDELTLNNIKSVYRQSLATSRVDFNPDTLDKMSPETLIHSAVYYLPISVEDKQLMLESKTLRDKATILLSALNTEDSGSHTKH